jgi:hypothetical protein
LEATYHCVPANRFKNTSDINVWFLYKNSFFR